MEKRDQDAKELAEMIVMFMGMNKEDRSRAFGYMRGICDAALVRQSEVDEDSKRTSKAVL